MFMRLWPYGSNPFWETFAPFIFKKLSVLENRNRLQRYKFSIIPSIFQI